VTFQIPRLKTHFAGSLFGFPSSEVVRSLNALGDRLRTAGKSTGELVQMWNEANPEDLIEFQRA
jgi:hypothetical protein